MAVARKRKASRSAWGKVRKLPSGRHQASYVGPDGERYTGPMTYTAKADADAWLATQRAAMVAGTWVPSTPAAHAIAQVERAQTLAAYADRWVATRTGRSGEPLRPRTLEEYRRLIRGPIAPLGSVPLANITPSSVREWRAAELAKGTLTQAGRAYDLLKSILSTAVTDGLIKTNPCNIRGASSSSSRKAVVPPTEAELNVVLAKIAPRFKAMVVLAAFGGLRFGELTELRRRDLTIDAEAEIVRVRVERAVTYTAETGYVVGPPKSDAGVRTVALFAMDARDVINHLDSYDVRFGGQLVFPGTGDGHLGQSTFHRHWATAREAAERPDMPFHALRHYAGTRYAQAGATPRETMARLGHSTMAASLRYQHSGNRDDELAARMARRGISNPE